ncbi:MAG: methionyl-tRNA formyltransferase [Tagaea sp.]
MRLAFMGTPDFAVGALAALVQAGHQIACVYTQPPRPAGRGQKDQPSPVHARAAALGLNVRHPTSLKSPDEQAAFAGLALDAAVVAAYGLILPKPILDAPLRGCLNIHASLLPRWRGAAPIQRAIEAGDKATGITIMQMDEGLDTGAMLLKAQTPILATTTGGALHDTLAAMGAKAIVQALAKLDDLRPEIQPETGVTYAKKLDKAEAKLDWTRPAAELERRIRAFDPFPGTWFEAKGERIKVSGAKLADGTGTPGTVIAEPLVVACGEGALALTRLQRAGRSASDADAFVRGFDLPVGTKLA